MSCVHPAVMSVESPTGSRCLTKLHLEIYMIAALLCIQYFCSSFFSSKTLLQRGKCILFCLNVYIYFVYIVLFIFLYLS